MVYIVDMQPDRHEATKRSAKRFRELCQAANAICPSKPYFGCSCTGKQRPCRPPQPTPDFFETVYTRDADDNSDLSPALLCTSGEVRRETHAIFYQENTSFFDSMCAVMPFLKDRTPESPAKIKSIGFHLKIDGCVERNPVCLDWVCTFRGVGCTAGSKVQILSRRSKGRRYQSEKQCDPQRVIFDRFLSTSYHQLSTTILMFFSDSGITSSSFIPFRDGSSIIESFMILNAF